MNKIEISKNKRLKLVNPLVFSIDLSHEDQDIEVVVRQMESIIRARGAQPVGPLIQYTEVKVDEQGEGEIILKVIRQADKYLTHIEPPYSMEPLLEVSNCMYARFHGPEEKLPLAYQKLQVEAFENDITLSDANYTVFVDGDEDGNIMADVFIKKI